MIIDLIEEIMMIEETIVKIEVKEENIVMIIEEMIEENIVMTIEEMREEVIVMREEMKEEVIVMREEKSMKNLVWLNLRRISLCINDIITSQPIVNENPYGALGDDSEEEDTSVCIEERFH